MKKALSLILVLAMLFSFMPCAFATESENAGEYNSLKLPVRNEVREEGTAEEEQEMPMMFSSRPMTLSGEATDNTTPSAGGGSGGGGGGAVKDEVTLPDDNSSGGGSGSSGGGGGGSATVVPKPDVPEETSTVIRATIDSPRSEAIAKGYSFRITDIISLLDEDIADTMYDLFYVSYFRGVYFTYENSETKEELYTNSRLYRNSEEGSYDLIIPVPKELENGEYNVEAHYIGEISYGICEDCTEFVLSFPITVCEPQEDEGGDEVDEKDLWSLNDTVEFKEKLVEPDNVGVATLTFENKLPSKCGMTGFAVDEKGKHFYLEAYCDGKIVEFESTYLGIGEYDCYFAISNWVDEGEEDPFAEYSNTLFGPVKLKINELYFNDDFYKFTSNTNSEDGILINVDIKYTSACKIPVDYQGITESLTVSLNFKNEQGNSVKSVSGLYVDWLSVPEEDWQDGLLEFYMENIDIAPGKYDVEVTLCGPDEDISLGSGSMLIIDDPIIEKIGILNYGDVLTPATESFYVMMRVDELYLDCEKYNINMLDSEGNVVAETVSKDLGYMNTYEGSELLYKLEVTEPLSMEEEYTLEIQAQKPMQVYSYCEEVYISVNDYAIVKYAALSGDVVKVYTENLPEGQYKVGENGTLTPIEIDENGVGTFVPIMIYDGYNYYNLYDEYGDYIGGFSVYKEYYDYPDKESYIWMEPYWIPEGETEITEVSLYTEDSGYTEEDIEYIHFIQKETTNDGDLQKTVIAQLKNFTTEVITEEGGGGNSTDIKEGYNKLVIIGDIVAEEGKSFIAGYTDIELKFKDGTVCNGESHVESNNTIAYASSGVNNHHISYGGYIDSAPNHVSYMISGNKLCYVLDRTNIRAAEMYLYKYDENGNRAQVGDTLKINSSLECCTKEHGVYYTYDIEFPTELEENTVYYMQIRTPEGDDICSFGNFVYTTEPIVRAYAWQDYDRVEIEVESLNLGDNPKLSFKAVTEDETEYDLPSILSYPGPRWSYYSADFGKIPAGRYAIKVYCDGEEIENIEGSYFYWENRKITKPVVYHLNYYKGELTVYGALLNTATDGYVEVYKEVDIEEAQTSKLEYAGRLELKKPFNQNYISVNSAPLKEMETGEYSFAVVIDGKVIGEDWAYIQGKEPEYSATLVLNGGRRYTNADSVELDITSNGYKWMKVAFSEEELAEAAYETISEEKTISIADKNGEITVYVQLANEEATKTETKELHLTIDRDEPAITEIQISDTLSVWGNAETSFCSNEILKNAYIVMHTENGEKQYPIPYETDTENNLYKYSGKAYLNSFYVDNPVEWMQIIATDRAGNSFVYDYNGERFNFLAPRTVSGTVIYNDSPVSNAYVYLYRVDGENEYYTGSAYTNEQGEYNFYNVGKDNYIVKVDKNPYLPAQTEIAAEEFNAGNISGKDIILESKYSDNSALTVRVKDNTGAPVEGVKVSVYSWYTGFDQILSTNAEGEINVSVPYSGSTYYSVYAYTDSYSDSRGIYVSSATEDVTLTMPRMGTITGTVLRNGEPVADEQIVIDSNYYWAYATTDEDGKFSATVYLNNEKDVFTVSVNNNSSKYSGSAEVVFENGEGTAEVTLNLKGNIRVKGQILDSVTQQPVTSYSSIEFSGNGMYITVTPDSEGNFETPDVFTAGKYTVYSYSSSWYNGYKTIDQTFEVTEEDLTTPIKELNLTAVKVRESQFISVGNSITATADVIAKGETVTVNVKFHNDGTQTLSNVVAYANVPSGATVEATNGTENTDGTVSKAVDSLKPDETGSLTFTLGTEDCTESALIIPGYVRANNKVYPIGSVSVQLVSATLTAPQVVKEGESFKVSGEALAGSSVEIQNYETKETLAVTNLVSKWYFADIPAQTEDITLVAKVTKEGKVGYSQPITVKVESDPIAVKDVIISWDLGTYGKNEYFGYPTFSMWEGYSFDIWVSFDNMPADATVKYSFVDAKNIPANEGGEYYKATINKWSGYGTKKIIATVTDDDKEYEFIVAEVIILIDPSGYITDEETGEPIVGASVLLEVKDANGDWTVWDGPLYGQQNPMLTDEEGHYGWMVTEGEYRIKVTKDGYESKTIEEYDSRDYGDNSKITVLPMRTDVDITLKSNRQAQINSTPTAVAGGKLKFTSSRPLNPATVTEENFKVTDSQGNDVNGEVSLAENNTVIIFKEKAETTPASTYAVSLLSQEETYTLTVSGIEDMDGNEISFVETYTKPESEVAALAKPTASVVDGNIKLTFAEGTAEIANEEEITVKKGSTQITGTFIWRDTALLFIPDSALSAGSTYTVVLPETLRTVNDNYLAKEETLSVTVSGGSTPPGDNDNDGPRGGGGGGGSSLSKPSASVPEGIVEKGTKVELTTGSKTGKIYYTLDGSVPTKNSTLYTEAIVINENTCIKAIVINGTMESSVLTLNYNVKGAQKAKFADIENYAWAQDAITQLSEKGIIKGVSETEFAPANNIKRADYMLLLVRMLGLEAEVTENFDDVDKDKYYYEALGVAKKLALTTGVGDNKFNPEASITRQDMFVLAYRILEMQNVEMTQADEAAISAFGDYDGISDYAKEALSVLVKNELVKGSDNKINPVGNATRAETAVFIYRLYNLLNK